MQDPMSSEIRERLASVETQMDQIGATMRGIHETLQELVRYTTRNEDNKRTLAKHDERLDTIESHQEQQRYRWWVIATVASVLTIIINILFNVL